MIDFHQHFELKKFFLMTRGRTGSTAVIDELNKSNYISAASELFLVYDFTLENAFTKNINKYYDLIMPLLIWKTKYPGADNITDEQLVEVYLAEAVKKAAETGAQWFGFKVLSHHFMQWPFLNDLLKKEGYKAIYLKRNIARQVLSGIVANKTGIFNSLEDVSDLGAFYVDPIDFETQIQYNEKVTEEDCIWLEKNGYDFIVVTYEDFCSLRGSFYKKIYKFLGLPMEIPPKSTFCVILKDLKKNIKNYTEIEEIAKKTGWTLNDL